jgi:hypothetical protein
MEKDIIMNGEWGVIWKEACVAYISELSCGLPVGIDEQSLKPCLR